MKKLLIFMVLPVFLTACYGTDGGSSKGKSFNQQLKELEREHSQNTETPYEEASTASIYQSEADRQREIEIAAQRERRATAPMVESDYIFRVMPDKGTYMYDEYNQVVTDDPKLVDYKETKRLWNKPKRFTPDVYGTEEVIDDGSGGEASYTEEEYAAYE